MFGGVPPAMSVSSLSTASAVLPLPYGTYSTVTLGWVSWYGATIFGWKLAT